MILAVKSAQECVNTCIVTARRGQPIKAERILGSPIVRCKKLVENLLTLYVIRLNLFCLNSDTEGVENGFRFWKCLHMFLIYI